MITTIKNQEQQSLSLPSLATEINAKHSQTINSARTTLVSAREAGELLIEAKAQVDHGQWAKWLSENCPDLSQRTANEYKQVANCWEAIESKLAVTANLTIGSALSAIAKPKEQAEPTAKLEPVASAQPTPETTAFASPSPVESAIETEGVLSTMADSPTTTETEQPEVVQRVQAALRSHFAEDELPSEESHCKAIASCDEDVWRDVVEAARERSAMRDSDPKLQDFRDAAKEQSWQHQRKLADKFGVLAMHSLDELHELKPNPMRHGTAMKHIQAFLNELKGWN